MKSKIASLTLTFVVILCALYANKALAQGDQTAPPRSDLISESDTAFQYRLFETSNLWTFILLDTVYGRAWQIQYSVDDSFAGKILINGQSLLPQGATPENGRYTLYPTKNLYNFLLLDREDGRIWQLQWSMKSEHRGIMRALQ